jgi:hypothetical protein
MGDWTTEAPITPSVCEEREFLEIAEDFSNPCEIFREAISNAFDAGATEIRILLNVIQKGYRPILRIEIADNGKGMTRDQLCAFFDLGNSTNRDRRDAIGEKGHGTTIYYKSSRIEVVTNAGGCELRAEVREPYDALATGAKPVVNVSSRPSAEQGTKIIVDDYNHSIRDKFTHAILKDYIYWYTKFGSVEREFGITKCTGVVLWLKGVDRADPEQCEFGHIFPPISADLNRLLDTQKAGAPDFFVKRWSDKSVLRNFPDIEYEVLFYLEGDAAKRSVNPMIRGKGRSLQAGAYNVQDRYGLWLCRDYMPIQRMNEWITIKGSEYTRFHAFVNCQGFRLTANRGSVMNTPPNIMDDIRNAVSEYFRTVIMASSEFSDLEYLERESAAYINQEKDERDFDKRIRRLPKRRFASYRGAELIEPENEVGVLTLVTTIAVVDPAAFPFRILDYTTYRGYDALATVTRDDLPLEKLSKGYIEFKWVLDRRFDHLFKHLFGIVCWRIAAADGEQMTDVGGNRRTLQIVPGDPNRGEYTKYYLHHDRERTRIEVFVLSEYLKDALKLDFKHRP